MTHEYRDWLGIDNRFKSLFQAKLIIEGNYCSATKFYNLALRFLINL